MPKAGSHSSRHTRSSHPTSLDVHHCSVEQVTRLPAEVLRLHLLSKHLITTGTKAVLYTYNERGHLYNIAAYCTVENIDIRSLQPNYSLITMQDSKF